MMRCSFFAALVVVNVSVAAAPLTLTRADGVQLIVSDQNTQPVLLLVLPGQRQSDRAAEILFPEHVTVRRHGASQVEHLYMFAPGTTGAAPHWRSSGSSIEYDRELPHGVRMLARATLEADGVLFHYEFTNTSPVAYDMIYAVTDPRLQSSFHDVRLERTYVHHENGFDLLASETPGRLTLPLDEWLPARYLASLTWPVPARRVERRPDGITYYYKSRKVDEPFIATLSQDRTWLIGSFTREAGNVWSNPDLTCQHVDPQVALPPDQKVVLEMKMLVFRGTLEEAQRKVVRQRSSLR